VACRAGRTTVADFPIPGVDWPKPDPIMDAVFKAAEVMPQSLLIRTVPLGELMQFARALLAGNGAEVATLPHWEPCNPGCDPEFNGQRSRHCAKLCQNARDALKVADGVNAKESGDA
jgi:hypothetical protein